MNISLATASSMSSYFKDRLAAARLPSFGAVAPESKTVDNRASAAVLQTANTAMFQMVDLMSRARSLGRQAEMLSAGNAAGVDALRARVADMLKESTKIATTAGVKTEATSTKADSKPPTLDELRSTLSGLQSNLSGNIKDLGGSVQKAISYNSRGTSSY